MVSPILYTTVIFLTTHHIFIHDVFYLRRIVNTLFRIQPQMKPASNYIVVQTGRDSDRPIFTLNLSFFSKSASSFYMITIYAVYIVHLNGSGTAVISMTLPDFDEEELDL